MARLDVTALGRLLTLAAALPAEGARRLAERLNTSEDCLVDRRKRVPIVDQREVDAFVLGASRADGRYSPRERSAAPLLAALFAALDGTPRPTVLELPALASASSSRVVHTQGDVRVTLTAARLEVACRPTDLVLAYAPDAPPRRAFAAHLGPEPLVVRRGPAVLGRPLGRCRLLVLRQSGRGLPEVALSLELRPPLAPKTA